MINEEFTICAFKLNQNRTKCARIWNSKDINFCVFFVALAPFVVQIITLNQYDRKQKC